MMSHAPWRARHILRRMGDDGAAVMESAVEPILGTLELDEADLRAGIVQSSGVLRARLGIVLVVAFCYSMLGLMNGGVPLTQNLPSMLVGAAFVAVLFASPRWRARQLLRALAAGGDRHASFRFDAEGVTYRTAGSTTTTSYRSLVEYRETKSSFLVYASPGIANIVPKRAFSPSDVARVGALLAANVKRKRARGGTRLVILWFSLILFFLVVWQFLSAK
jgi:hypothetical protein